jgi:hypothetical protein
VSLQFVFLYWIFWSHLNEQLNNNHLTHRQQIQGFTYQQAMFNPPKRDGQATATNATIASRPRGVIFNMDGTFEPVDPPMKTPASGWNKQPGNITSAHRPIHLFPGSAGKREQGSHYVRCFLFVGIDKNIKRCYAPNNVICITVGRRGAIPLAKHER